MATTKKVGCKVKALVNHKAEPNTFKTWCHAEALALKTNDVQIKIRIKIRIQIQG